jgi:C4-dicarboxylate-specific signal transduction histidine kinase
MSAYDRAVPTGLRSAFSARSAAFLLTIVLCIVSWPAAATDQRRRIYFLESLSPTQPAAIRTIEAFKRRLSEKTTETFDIFIDYMELARFPGQAHIDRTVQFLAGKYAELPPDVLIPLGRAAVPFMLRYRNVLASEVPIIFTSVPARTANDAPALANTAWVVTEYNFAKTLELARRLQPRAGNLVLVAGASEYDRSWSDDARRELELYADRYKIRYLVGLPYDEMLMEVSRLPPDTIVMISFFFEGADGLPRLPPEVAAAVAKISPAPVYSPASTFFDRGIIGGYMDSYEAHGVAAADLAFEILSGKGPASLDKITKTVHRYQVDARQLERWGLSARNLPPDTVVSFQDLAIWESHRDLVLAAGLVFALQTVFVGALLIQRRRMQLAEGQLRESEERMTFAAASANIGLWQFDRETNEFWGTEHCRALFGQRGGVPLTREVFLSAIHPEDRAIAISTVRANLKARQSAFCDVRVVLPDSLVRWVRVRARLLPDDRGAPNRISGIFIDVTESKVAETEAELQRQEVAHLMRVSVLGELSGAIAHEVNQPLTAILSNAQSALHLLAQKSPDLAELREALEDIVHENNRAGEVIHRLRNLLKKGEMKSEPVDVNDLVNSTISLINSELISRRINVKVDLAHDLPAMSGDPIQLQQVLLNLLINAMDAMASTPAAQQLVTISTGTTPTGAVELVVKDRGPGIRPVAHGRLFEPFFTTKEHGLGLGLTICSTIVQAHGGKLSLSNDDAGGAVARFSLPAQEMLIAAQ